MRPKVIKVQNAFPPRKRSAGFTLIEVMITVVIIGILAAIALPNYSEYVMRGRIPDATSNLASLAVKMEQAFQDNRTYQPTTASVCAVPPADLPSSMSKYFKFSCVTNSATTFTFTASGLGNMSAFEYTIDQSNKKTSKGPTGWATVTDCWLTNKSGC
jgi:type IV pilus assembly protein PilE